MREWEKKKPKYFAPLWLFGVSRVSTTFGGEGAGQGNIDWVIPILTSDTPNLYHLSDKNGLILIK